MHTNKTMIKETTLQIAGEIKGSSVNGDGIRYTIFLSGCNIKCDGCHSPHTHNPEYGGRRNIIDIFYDIYSRRKYIDGVSISGGEPTLQSEPLIELLKLLKLFDFNVWLWSGHKMEQLKLTFPNILKYVDVVIDGKFEKSAPTKKPYRGSENQRMFVVTRPSVKNTTTKFKEVK